MTLKTTVLFGLPQQDISGILLKAIRDCQKMSMVTGFLTVEGAKVLLPALHSSPSKLKTLVVGAGTYRGFEALDELLVHGVSRSCLHVHLGYTRKTTSKAKHPFYRYHPMLHSKVSLFEMANGEAVAFVGSHNITGFALLGLNGEASVMLEGKITDPEIQKIKRHISISQSQSVLYEPSKKEAYAWWTKQFFDGLAAKANGDMPKDNDFESQKTIVFLGAQSENNALKKGDVIYFEIPANLKQIQSIREQVHIHIYVLDSVPESPLSALSSIAHIRRGFSCTVSGLEVEGGGVELQADWHIPDRYDPKLIPTLKPFRPLASFGMQQVRVTVKDEIKDSYEYLFDNTRETWEPALEIINASPEQQENFKIKDELDDNSLDRMRLQEISNFVEVNSDYKELFKGLKLIPTESERWFRVYDLYSGESGNFSSELRDWFPESGSFILISLRRRKRS
jgi:hypothetical protein